MLLLPVLRCLPPACTPLDQPRANSLQLSGSTACDVHAPPNFLQGIRGSDRARLLALCLAALEAQVTALPPGAGMMANGPAEWRHLATALLALATLAAAAAWLGYVPARLLAAAAACLAEVPPSVLQAAGLASGAAAVQQQAMAAAAAAAVGEDDAEKEDGGGEGPEAVQWYCLAERLPLYSGVLRLLTCSSIEQQAEQQPAQAPGAAAAALALAPGEASAAEAGTEQQQEPGGALAPNHSSSPTGLARQQALAVLRQGSDGLPGSIRGWRASATGTRSDSQLLALAPAALQDWAVTAADAVAAAYLSDAADTGPSAAALRSGLAGSSAVMAAAASGGEDRQQQQQAGSNGAQQETALVSGSSSSGTGAAPAALFASSAPLEAGWWPTFVHRQLCNTRQLQRFANAVLLQRWVSCRGLGWGAGTRPAVWPPLPCLQAGSCMPALAAVLPPPSPPHLVHPRFSVLYCQLDARYRGVADMYEDRLRLWGVAAAGRRLEVRCAGAGGGGGGGGCMLQGGGIAPVIGADAGSQPPGPLPPPPTPTCSPAARP